MADLASNGDSALKKASTVGRPSNFYPSPFFDLARTYLPDTIKETFSWCAYYYMTSPIINGVVNKLASYAVTDLVYPADPEAETFRALFEGPLKLRTVLVEHNLDRHCFGNAFMSVVFPIRKLLQCKKCSEEVAAERADYKWRNGQFYLSCGKCGETSNAKARDETVPAPNKIRLIRWDPRSITIRNNSITGETRYFYTVPRHLKNEIQLNSRRVVETTPQAFLDALASNKLIELSSDSLFHARRPSISRAAEDTGWGTPLILPVLKDVFLLQVLKKSQEMVAMEMIVPFRALYPEVRSDGNNIYANVNLEDWRNSIKKEVETWKKDAAHIAVCSTPIGQQTLGGNGRGLLLHQEVRIYSDQIIAGMGVPTGFFYGESQWSGANVNLRALENEFIANREDLQHLVEFIIRQVARGLGINTVKVNFKPFKMADDMQRAGMSMNLVNGQMISRRTFLEGLDYDVDKENAQIREEQEEMGRRAKNNAENQAAAQAVMTQGQTSMQAAQAFQQQRGQELLQRGAQFNQMGQPPPPPLGPAQTMAQSPIQFGGAQPALQDQAAGIARQLAQLDEVSRYRSLAQLRGQSPDLYALVNKMLTDGSAVPGPAPLQQLPEQLPPRRGPGTAQT